MTHKFGRAGRSFGNTGRVYASARILNPEHYHCVYEEPTWRPEDNSQQRRYGVEEHSKTCHTTYDEARGVKRTHCDDGTGEIDLYRLNEQLDRAGWATYKIPIADAIPNRRRRR